MAGYYNYSKSNNAVNAEASGRYPATKCAKIYGFKSAKDVRQCLKSREWHHVSKKYNIVDYYDFEEHLQDCEELFELYKIYPHLKKSANARDLIWNRAIKIIKKNLSYDDFWAIHDLRMKSGYYKKRNRNKERETLFTV